MAVLTCAALRQRIETALAALSGWQTSPLPFDVFGEGAGTVLHRGFAVGVPSSIWTQTGRQRRSTGALVETTVAVRFARKVRPQDQRASYDDLLGDEVEIIAGVMGIAQTNLTGPVYSATPRREVLAGGEWLLGECTFAAQHFIALE